MPEKILVTGATGKVGREVVRRLVEAGADVMAGTRRPEQARELFDARVEPIELDWQRTETYDAATMFADRIFLMPPPFDPKVDEDLVPFLDWAVSANTRHLVLLSAMGVEGLDWLALRKVERRIEQIGADWTFLRPNWYMQNFSTGYLAEEIRAHGRFALAAGDGRVSTVDVRDVAAVAAAALLSEDHIGKAYTLTGPDAIDHHAIAAAISAAAGRDVVYEPIDDEDMRARLRARHWPGDQIDIVLGLMRAIRNGERAAVSDDAGHAIGHEPGGFEDFARQHAAAWR